MPTKKQYTKQEINDQIETVLADNSTQAITASDVRSIVKDYMTASTYAPVLIYAGLIKHYEGSGSAAESIQEFYFNPEFFQKQTPTTPTASTNIYRLSGLAVAASNGTYTVNASGGNGSGLQLKFEVDDNYVETMEVVNPGAGYKVGNILNVLVGSTTLDVTYNGAIRHNVGNLFTMTTNSDNTFSDHTALNTIISSTPQDINDANSFDRITKVSSNNTIQIELDDGSIYSEHYLHVQLYRVAGL